MKPRPVLMPNNASATAGPGRHDVLKSMFGRSSTTETLPGGDNKNPKKTKANPFSVSKKLNTKIQALSGKLTEIIVWSTKLAESTLPLDRTLKHSELFLFICSLMLTDSWTLSTPAWLQSCRHMP